ncbi:hypothetical protein GW17_00010547 [Ensete ventricosum]|nr:hypothetical protein GW17_00010547 [Ensete ventricosum]
MQSTVHPSSSVSASVDPLWDDWGVLSKKHGLVASSMCWMIEGGCPTQDLVELECQRWASKGVDIKYEIRDNRSGYKAGALKEGMKRSYVKHCDYVVIFDADFQPEPDFLWRTIPFLIHNPDVDLVHSSAEGAPPVDSVLILLRTFAVNSDECLMTRMQEMSLDYHFTVEQEVGSSTYAFFGFNGTAGVWRIAALNEAGGWKDRTTVEDMDLAVRASLKGWKFVFLGDLKAIYFGHYPSVLFLLA